MEPNEIIVSLRDKLSEEQKETIWDSISNKKTWMEISNLSDEEKAKLILDTWNQIEQKENQEPEIIERKLTPENFDEVKKLILENEVDFDFENSTIKITKK